MAHSINSRLKIIYFIGGECNRIYIDINIILKVYLETMFYELAKLERAILFNQPDEVGVLRHLISFMLSIKYNCIEESLIEVRSMETYTKINV